MKKYCLKLLLLCLLPFMVTFIARGQECKVIKDYQDGSYLVQIGNKNLLAISEEQEKNFLNTRTELMDARRTIAVKDQLLANYDKVKAQYDTTLQQQKEYIAELESVSQGYKRLAADYKRLKEPWVTVDGGIGATGGDTEPAVVLGIGIRALRLSGFFQKKNSGALIGISLPLF